MFYTHVSKKELDFVVKFPYKIGIVTFMIFPELLKSDEGAADKIKLLINDPFFDLLELSPINDREWKKLQSYSRSSKIEFALGLQPEILVRGYNPSAIDENERKRAEDILARDAEIACKRGMKAIAMCSGPTVPEQKRKAAVEAFVRTAITISEKISRYDVPLLIETFDVKWDKKRLLGNLEFSAEVLEKIRENYSKTYLLWDLSHAPMLNEKPENLKPYSDLLGHVHVGCTKRVENRLYDWHPGFHRPGSLNDENDIAKLLEVLHDIKYKGAMSFEVKPEEGQTPMEVIHTAKSVLIRSFQMYLEEVI